MFRVLKKLFQRKKSSKLFSRKHRLRLEKLINHKVTLPEYFIEALTHRSVLEQDEFELSNERLEYLGDAVLGLIVGEFLFKRFPDTNEGNLTKMRANLVNKKTLYLVAKKLDLFDLIYINEDLTTCENFGYKTILADALEALIGAVYLDCGLSVTADFIHKYIIQPNMKLGVHINDDNYKSQLLEYLQGIKHEMPRYSVIHEEGPEHDRVFTVKVTVGHSELGVGKGRSKKAAEQSAAREALRHIEDETGYLPGNGHYNGNGVHHHHKPETHNNDHPRH